MTPEQESRARMLRRVLASPERQQAGPTLEDAWASIAALNLANDQLRADLECERMLARGWRFNASVFAALGLLLLGVVVILAFGCR